MRVLRDVIIHRSGPDELLAVSQTPGLLGEEMSLDMIGGGASVGLRVKVIDSRPIIVDGSVRHRIRLALVNAVKEARPSAQETVTEAGAGPALAVEAV